MNARLYRLLEAHQRIDRALRDEMRRRRPDDFQVSRLKKLKLRVKDLTARLSTRRSMA